MLQWLSIGVIFACDLGTSEGNSAPQMIYNYALHDRQPESWGTEEPLFWTWIIQVIEPYEFELCMAQVVRFICKSTDL